MGEIAELEAEEQRLLEELKAFDREEEELREDLERHRRHEEQLNREEDNFWLGVASHQLELAEIEDERAATASSIQYATSELNRLKRTNVLTTCSTFLMRASSARSMDCALGGCQISPCSGRKSTQHGVSVVYS